MSRVFSGEAGSCRAARAGRSPQVARFTAAEKSCMFFAASIRPFEGIPNKPPAAAGMLAASSYPPDVFGSAGGIFTVGGSDDSASTVSSGISSATGSTPGCAGTMSRNARRHFGHFGLYRPGAGFFAVIDREQYGHGNRTATALGAKMNRRTPTLPRKRRILKQKVGRFHEIAFSITFPRTPVRRWSNP
jgi:hypothetical protein